MQRTPRGFADFVLLLAVGFALAVYEFPGFRVFGGV